MQTKVQKWGNSLGLRIPKPFATEIGLIDNSLVDMSIVDHQLVIKPIPRVGLTLDELVSQITDDNLHGEIGTGASVGAEVW